MNTVRQARFQQEGYLLGVEILTPEEVLHYRAAYERLAREHALQGNKGRITNRHHDDADCFALATHPNVLAVARECFGPDLVLISTGFFAKEPDGSGAFVDWHQDTTYWGLLPPKAMTVWIAIDDADVENGAMRLIPRSHRQGLLPHTTARRAGNLLGQNQAIETCHFDESTAVDCVLKAGHASVHDGEIVHGSNPNRSSRRRCGMTVRFTTPDVRPVLEGTNTFRDRPLLVLGDDRFGHFSYAPRPAFARGG